MSFPTIESAIYATGSDGGLFSIAKPTGLANGDLLVWISSTSRFNDMALPTGFTQKNARSSGAWKTVVATKPIKHISQEPANYAVQAAPADSGGTIAAALIRVSGCNLLNPVDAAAAANSTDGPDITTTIDNQLVFTSWGKGGASLTLPTKPSEATLLQSFKSANGVGSSDQAGLVIGYLTKTTAGLVSIGLWSISGLVLSEGLPLSTMPVCPSAANPLFQLG